jgi:DNA gyrase subunit B
MTDADVDGAHIRTLLLTFFFRYFPELIDRGHLYIAQPPLFKMQRGKDVAYAYSDAQKVELLTAWGVKPEETEVLAEGEEDEVVSEEVEDDVAAKKAAAKKAAQRVARLNIQRYKGLGEMNAEQLWETTMDPERRLMLKVTMEDAERANLVFTTLMGSEVAPRRKFIQTHAKAVKNLDI